ncbi:MAG: hypothetical protein LBN05_02370 [Oscillospiraceae bacterium]|jgi:REP element-mobilizing transposase RayT|nr:hypothetical protein [Oscillospiraceae bacterium]
MNNMRTRKPNRLQGYDYARNGAYFVTICAKDRVELFGRIVGGDVHIAPKTELSDIGKIINTIIDNLSNHRHDICVDKYIIMPNHLHLIVIIDKRGDVDIAPYGVSDFVRTLKIMTTKQIGFSPWQRSFHDHIIRNEEEFFRIANYIVNNPAHWQNDCFYEDTVATPRP